MPECRSTILIDREAKRRRKTGEDPNVYGPNELKNPRISLKEAGKIWLRPFEMFLREPIVLFLSILSGFSDALIFTFLESFAPVYEQWDFGTLALAWAFIPINLAYFLAYFSYLPWFVRDENIRKTKGNDALLPERRLKWLLWLAPLEPIGLFGFAWTSLGPPRVHWIAPMIFSVFIGVANYAIYFSSVDCKYLACRLGQRSLTRLRHGSRIWSVFSIGHWRKRVCSRLSRWHCGDVCNAALYKSRQQAPYRICKHDSRLSFLLDRHSDIHFLLEGAVDQSKQQVCSDAGC